MSLGSACGPVFDGRCWATFAESDSSVHEAAQNGDLDALENGLKAAEAETSDINERNPLGCTPLRIAAAGLISLLISILCPSCDVDKFGRMDYFCGVSASITYQLNLWIEIMTVLCYFH